MNSSTVRELIDAGIHFGHRVGRWNPKMKPYVLCARNSIHIIDVKQTIRALLRARKFLAHVVASGQDVLLVGTKRQARQPIVENAIRCSMPYVCERWLGGTLTNFRTIRSRLGRLEELENMDEHGLMASQSKKMEASLRREMRKTKRNLDGIRTMSRLPGALVLIDTRREHLAVAEARKLKIPTVALIDTDSDPDLVDLPIPGNDDAMRTIEIIITQLVDAVMEGMAGRTESASPGDETPAQKPRSRRVTTAQAAEAAVADPTPAAPDSKNSAAPDGPATAEPTVSSQNNDPGPAQ